MPIYFTPRKRSTTTSLLSGQIWVKTVRLMKTSRSIPKATKSDQSDVSLHAPGDLAVDPIRGGRSDLPE